MEQNTTLVEGAEATENSTKELTGDKIIFTNLHSTYMKKPKIDKEKMRIKVVEAPKVVKEPEPFFTTKEVYRMELCLSKVTDGLNRCNTSLNKKNTIFLANNLRMIIETAQKLLDKLVADTSSNE